MPLTHVMRSAVARWFARPVPPHVSVGPDGPLRGLGRNGGGAEVKARVFAAVQRSARFLRGIGAPACGTGRERSRDVRSLAEEQCPARPQMRRGAAARLGRSAPVRGKAGRAQERPLRRLGRHAAVQGLSRIRVRRHRRQERQERRALVRQRRRVGVRDQPSVLHRRRQPPRTAGKDAAQVGFARPTGAARRRQDQSGGHRSQNAHIGIVAAPGAPIKRAGRVSPCAARRGAAAAGRNCAEVILCPHRAATDATCDLCAPEHLRGQVADSDRRLARPSCARARLAGEATPLASGDKASGTHRVLPTSGAARGTAGPGMHTFLKVVTSATARPRDGGRPGAEATARIARPEGPKRHGRAAEMRLPKESPGARFDAAPARDAAGSSPTVTPG
ncbi:hypothetical protein DXV76_07490 [Rhodobacteraceae bacterium CCMM004]|nr:hypothetical protein DXV76_07490 [Rhodobacteraceae bacterium CCMM004]